MPRNRFALFAGVFLTAFSVILYEISLTRVFAVMMWHHFAPMVVSLALLGFGASGSLLTATKEGRRDDDPLPRLATYATLYAAALVLGFCFVTLIRVDTLHIGDPANLLGLLFCYLVVSVPFLLAGLVIGIALTRYAPIVGRVYFADLVGSGIGGAASAFLLGGVGSTASIMAAGAAAALAAFVFAWPGSPARRLAQGLLLVPAAALVVGFSGGGLGVPAMSWPVPFAPEKYAGAPNALAGERLLPSAVAQVDVSGPFPHHMAAGGHFGDRDWQEQVMLRGVTQDGTAPTALYEQASDLSRFPSLDDTQAAAAYVAARASGRTAPEVLVIGVGGGIDIMIALAHGASSVTGVELNEAMVRMVEEEYADYIGRLFEDKRVRLVHEEGRSFLRRGSGSYDLIQMSGVDTYTALSLGAQTLGESYLYTLEAVQDFYRHLKDGGYICYSRFLMVWPNRPRETIRLANTAREALAGLGVEDPASHVLVLQAHGWGSTVIKKGPFTRAEVEAIRGWAAEENFLGLAFDPLRRAGDPLAVGRLSEREYRPKAREALDAAMQLLPGAHRRPVEERWVELASRMLRAHAERRPAESDQLMAALLRELPDDPTGQLAAAVDQGRPLVTGLLNAEKRIAHFDRVQEAFFTLLRAEATERESFLRNYPYDLRPATDDKPFFFDYFKVSSLFRRTAREGDFFERDLWKDGTGSGWHPGFPVGHAVLLVSMVQIALLAFVLILLPVRKLEREGYATRGSRLRYLLYFGALGVGFMLIEISLMQKFVLFLGNPTYSLSVVLAGVLVASGLGSLATSFLRRVGRGAILVVLAAIVAVVAFDLWAVNRLLPACLGFPLWQRIAITLAVMGATGFVLGTAFPLGLRVVQARKPVLVPWAWAINGFLSVFSSLLAIVLAMAFGFTWALVIAAVVYAVGLAGMHGEPREAPAPPAARAAATPPQRAAIR